MSIFSELTNKDYNFIIDDYDNGEIVKVDAKTNKVTTLLDYMGDRKNRMYVMNLNGDLVAWSEWGMKTLSMTRQTAPVGHFT